MFVNVREIEKSLGVNNWPPPAKVEGGKNVQEISKLFRHFQSKPFSFIGPPYFPPSAPLNAIWGLGKKPAERENT